MKYGISTDAVPVVRCKECIYYSPSTMKCFKPVDDEHIFHDYAAPIWKPDDFCSYAKIARRPKMPKEAPNGK